ncbi:hypothetical protein JS756_25225 [Streptomyces actuosus]|uniref:PBS lyase n=1 Tax=Streptomyces actuosus TaxID=1885 RepID=A0ABS2VW26_STRAS|nr:hypothetical protein [Streptomyces actuosus]
MLSGDDPRAWLELDAAARDGHGNGTRELAGPAGAAGPSFALGRSGEARLALALCHRDGRVRERALVSAAGRPRLLPLVVIRTTDWAGPVRERAQELLRGALDMDTAPRLAPLILLVGHRARGGAGVELLTEVLRTAPMDQLAPLLTHPDPPVRRFAHRLAVGRGLLPPAELARTAARDPDTVVQTLCAEAAIAAGTGDDVLAPLLGARNPQVRAAGVTALRRAAQPDGVPPREGSRVWTRAEGFLADRAPVVRACARYVVRQCGGDPHAWYRARCADPGDAALPPGAVVGLAECGDRTDTALLWPLAEHPQPGVRARAVAGLRLLDSADAGRLARLLHDAAPGVVRETTESLLPSARSLDASVLTGMLAPARPRHQRVAAFRLLEACGGLARLRAAVALLDDPDARVRARAERSVQAWRATADVPPGSAEVGRLLDRGRRLLGDDVLRRRRWEAGLRG